MKYICNLWEIHLAHNMTNVRHHGFKSGRIQRSRHEPVRRVFPCADQYATGNNPIAREVARLESEITPL